MCCTLIVQNGREANSLWRSLNTKLLNRFGKRPEKAIALDFAKVKFDRENVRALTLMRFGRNDRIIK